MNKLKGSQLDIIKNNLTDKVENFVSDNKDKINAILRGYNGIVKNTYRNSQHILGTKETSGEKEDITNTINKIVEKEFANYFKENAIEVSVSNLEESSNETPREFYQVEDLGSFCNNKEKVTYLGVFQKKVTNGPIIEGACPDCAPGVSTVRYNFSIEEVNYDSTKPPSSRPVFYELKPIFEKPDEKTIQKRKKILKGIIEKDQEWLKKFGGSHNKRKLLVSQIHLMFYESKYPDLNQNSSGGKRRKSRRNRKSKKGKKSRKARKSRRKSNRRR